MTLFLQKIMLAVFIMALIIAVPIIAKSADPNTNTQGNSSESNPAAITLSEKSSPLASLPTKIPYGSIRIDNYDGDITQFASLATVTLDDAIRSTRRHLNEQITEVKLTVAGGYLVWRVMLVRGKDEGAYLMIDAGSGDLLALVPLPQTRPWWNF